MRFGLRYDSDTEKTVIAQRRRGILDSGDTLRGFYTYVKTLDAKKVEELLGEDLILFGEWLQPHAVEYPKDAYGKMHVFDVYSISQESYLGSKLAFEIADKLGIPKVPVFYVGEFISWEYCNSFVGKTALGGEFGEGVVIKGSNNRAVKIVGEKFQETKGYGGYSKKLSLEEMELRAKKYEIAESIITEARVRKILYKLVDEGIIREDWDEHDMGTIAKHLPKRIFEDCMKEELETVKLIQNDFGKICGSLSMKTAKKVLMNKA